MTDAPPPGESMNYRDSRVALSRWSTRLTPSWLWPCAVHYVYTSTLSMITMCSAYLIWYNHCWCYYYHYSICGNDASITTTTKATTSTTTTITTTASTVVFIIIFFYRVPMTPCGLYNFWKSDTSFGAACSLSLFTMFSLWRWHYSYCRCKNVFRYFIIF